MNENRPRVQYNATPDAEALYKSMKGMGTDDKTLSTIIVERTRDQMQEIKRVFHQKYGKSLESWIKGDTSGNYRELLLALIEEEAEYDAKLVRDAVKGLGTNDDQLIEVLCTRTNAELRAMTEAYRRLFNKDVAADVVGDTSGNYRALLMAVLKADRPEGVPVDVEKAKADAKHLYEKGEARWGTDEKVFIEIMTQRSFPQLQTINQAYTIIAGHSLEKGISKETSGNFKKALTILITPREEYFAEALRDAVAGMGTNDPKLIRVLSYLSNHRALFMAANTYYARKYQNNFATDIKGDTSGWYKKTCLALVQKNTAL